MYFISRLGGQVFAISPMIMLSTMSCVYSSENVIYIKQFDLFVCFNLLMKNN